MAVWLYKRFIHQATNYNNIVYRNACEYHTVGVTSLGQWKEDFNGVINQR